MLTGDCSPRQFRLLDISTFIYFCFVTLLVIWFHDRIANWHVYVLTHFVTLAAVVAYIKFAEKSGNTIIRLFRELYPLVLFTFTFKEVSLLLTALAAFWFETHLLAWDHALAGGYPTVLVQQYYRPWLTELMAFSYWAYYLIFPLTAVAILIRKEWGLLRSFSFHLASTMYACYLFYFFLPARGPQQTLAHLHLPREAAGFFDNMVLSIQGAASIAGNAFPSSHVAAVFIMLFFLFRLRRWLGWIVLPVVLALTVSTVYLQYHYVADAITGVLLAFLLYPPLRAIENWCVKKGREI